MSRAFSCCSDLAQDKVPYVQSPKFDPLVVILGHLFLILCHPTGCVVSYFVQAVQVESQFIVIESFCESFSSDARYPNLYWDYCFCAIGKLEGCLSGRGSDRGSVSLLDIGQFFWPGTFCFVQLGFDNFEQRPVRHFRLSICLGMPWG